MDRYPHELSGGMAQRLVTALALAPVTSLLIADEPTTGLDRPLVDHTLDLLRWTVDAAASAGSHQQWDPADRSDGRQSVGKAVASRTRTRRWPGSSNNGHEPCCAARGGTSFRAGRSPQHAWHS
ncbi:hypothetical protein [Micromonospora zamorensis]|uniref:hypothetical protein n=1 Tax=Micromonospora zamorensis TaxID=709883 RepID=UPI003F4C6F43